MAKYRFKTKEEFIEEGRWQHDYGVPDFWNRDGIMNHFLGQKIVGVCFTEKCDKGEALDIDGWMFLSEDYKEIEEKCCSKPDVRYNKHSDISVGTDLGHYRDLTFNYCNNCGEVWDVAFE